MAFNELFRTYPNRNMELRSVAKQFYEFGKTIAREPSAAVSSGMDAHALLRQQSYVTHAEKMVAAIASSPLPDNPATHPTQLPIDFSEAYITFVTDVNGNKIPLNESTQLLAEYWLTLAVELAKSQSASLAGSLITFDHDRAKNNLAAITKLLNELKDRPFLDLPETAEPGSGYEVRSGTIGGAGTTGR